MRAGFQEDIMKGKAGEFFRFDDKALAGVTQSQEISEDGEAQVVDFLLAPGTGISRESHPQIKFWLVTSGSGTAGADGFADQSLKALTAYAVPANVPAGIETEEGMGYVEAVLGEGTDLPGALKEGRAVDLASILPTSEGRILNMDLARSGRAKLALMSFGAGTGLPEHSAPGDALVFAIEGEGVIGYEGREHPVKSGDCFMFKKGGAHFVRAEKPFKMMLLVNRPH